MVKAGWQAPVAWCKARHALGFAPMTASTASFRRGPSALVTALLVLLVPTACGTPDKLPAPGADGLVVVHWWDEKKPGPPAYLQAEKVVQSDAEFGRLEFSTVLMRLPGDEGVIYVSAPLAVYDRGAKEEIILGAQPDRPVDGPVRFIGVWNDNLFMGRAAKGTFDEANHQMRLEDVEINSDGVRQHLKWAALDQKRQVPYGGTERLADAPGVVAALAALPAPLVLPPLRQ
jgi:hypothetical protein